MAQYISDFDLYSVPPIELKLIDGTSNSIITQAVKLPISFPTGKTFNIDFYVTPLNSSCPLVLGYNWLTHYNPLIDWVSGSITFCSTLLDTSILMTSPAASSTELTSQDPPILTSTPISAPHISFINGEAFACALQLPGVQSFSLSFSDSTITGKSASVSSDPNLSHVPEEYHDFADIVRGHPSEPISTTELYIPPHRQWPHCYPITYSMTYSVTPWHTPSLRDTFHHCSILPLFSLPLLFYVYS